MSMLTTHFSNLYMTPAIVKKLLGFKVNPQFESPDVSISNTSLSNHNKLCEKAIRNLVKLLKKTPGSLDELEKAVSTKNPNTKCILISFNNKTTNLQSDNRVATQSRKTLPHVVCCRIWRFPDLQNCNELKSNCQYGYNHNQTVSTNAIKRNDDSSLMCINPYHYVRCTETVSSIQQQQQQSQLTVYVPKQQILNTNINSNNNNNRKNLLDAKLNTITSLNNNNLIDINNHLQPMDITSPTNTTTTTTTITSTTTTELNSKTSLSLTNNNEIIPSPNDYMITTTNTTTTTNNNNNFIPLNNNNNNNNNGITTSSSSSGSTSSFIIHSPQSSPPPPPLSFKNNSILNNNQCSPISTSPASNAMMSQQFSPFISEDDSSEINDISPSPIGACELIGIPMIEQPYWCSLSYYEMKQRVGEMFHVASNVHSVTIDGYTDPSSAQRFCLGVLSNVNRTTEIEMTRHYIGRGLMLNYENGQVFAECLSENPVFVQSPNCNQRYHWHLATVVKIPPGCSLKIFDESDFVQLANETVFQGFEAVYALTRICTIRISFVKGWGAEYRRQTILNTPCWIEVHLNNPLKLVDQILTKMGSPRTKCTSFS